MAISAGYYDLPTVQRSAGSSGEVRKRLGSIELVAVGRQCVRDPPPERAIRIVVTVPEVEALQAARLAAREHGRARSHRSWARERRVPFFPGNRQCVLH